MLASGETKTLTAAAILKGRTGGRRDGSKPRGMRILRHGEMQTQEVANLSRTTEERGHESVAPVATKALACNGTGNVV